MTTKECGVLSFLVSIAVASLLREVPFSIFGLPLAHSPVHCSGMACGIFISMVRKYRLKL